MARQKKEETGPEATFESRFARLQEIVQALESGTLPLEAGVALFREGTALSRSCREQLDKARHEITLLSQDGPVPFAPEDAPEPEDAPAPEEPGSKESGSKDFGPKKSEEATNER